MSFLSQEFSGLNKEQARRDSMHKTVLLDDLLTLVVIPGGSQKSKQLDLKEVPLLLLLLLFPLLHPSSHSQECKTPTYQKRSAREKFERIAEPDGLRK